MKRWRYFLEVLMHPGYWLQNNSYSPEWDAWLNAALDRGEKFTRITQCRAVIGGKIVWIENHPYASFTPLIVDARPRRTTIARAHHRLICDLIEA